MAYRLCIRPQRGPSQNLPSNISAPIAINATAAARLIHSRGNLRAGNRFRRCLFGMASGRFGGVVGFEPRATLINQTPGLVVRGEQVIDSVDRKSTRLNSSHLGISYA